MPTKSEATYAQRMLANGRLHQARQHLSDKRIAYYEKALTRNELNSKAYMRTINDLNLEVLSHSTAEQDAMVEDVLFTIGTGRWEGDGVYTIPGVGQWVASQGRFNFKGSEYQDTLWHELLEREVALAVQDGNPDEFRVRQQLSRKIDHLKRKK